MSKPAKKLVVVNEKARGPRLEGTVLEYVRPGVNSKHVIVRDPGERRTFGFPSSWLDDKDWEVTE